MSHKPNPKDIDTSLFPASKAQQEVEYQQSKERPKLPTGLIFDNIPKAARIFNAVVKHLGSYRGINSAPLLFVVRENIYPPDGPDLLFTNAPRSRYISFDEEMI